MPRYDYDCPTCGVFEVEHSIKQDALATCPTCSSPIKRLISGAPLALWRGGPPTMKSYIKKAKEVFGVEKFYPDRPNNDVYGPGGRGR